MANILLLLEVNQAILNCNEETIQIATKMIHNKRNNSQVVICEIGYKAVILEKDQFTVTIMIIYSNLKMKTNISQKVQEKTPYYHHILLHGHTLRVANQEDVQSPENKEIT